MKTKPKTLKRKMIESIVNAKDLDFSDNPFYWYSQLDYSKETSHPEYQVLEDKVEADLKIIQKAKDLMHQYAKIGVDDIKEDCVRMIEISMSYPDKPIS